MIVPPMSLPACMPGCTLALRHTPLADACMHAVIHIYEASHAASTAQASSPDAFNAAGTAVTYAVEEVHALVL